jgi:hypothetical protein
VFDPSRLRGSPRQQERRGYAVVGQMLRDHLGGGEIFAEVRERARRGPKIRELLDGLKQELEVLRRYPQDREG